MTHCTVHSQIRSTLILVRIMTDVGLSVDATTISTWNMKDEIATYIRLGVDSLCSKNDATTEDILRIFQDQISNLFVTEHVRSALTADPFQHLKENIPQKFMEEIINSVSIVSHHSVKTMEGYVRTEAVVSLSKQPSEYVPPTSSNATSSVSINKKRPRTHHGSAGNLKLHFTYSRSSMTSRHPCTVSYTIDVCNTTEQARQPLLWVQVYAAGVVPSSHNSSHAININETDDDGQWSDIDDDENDDNDPIHENVSKDDAHEPSRKVELTSSCVNTPDVETSDSQIDNHIERVENGLSDNGSTVDRYEAGMDPDVVSVLVSHLSSITEKPSVKSKDFTCYGDITIFFLLMTFPFYEHEWDIVGFLLKAVFDSDNQTDGSEEG